jgi:hypothetical protein
MNPVPVGEVAAEVYGERQARDARPGNSSLLQNAENSG